MIRVNLLPPEKRKRERTPLPRFLTLIGGTVVNLAVIGAIVYIALQTRDARTKIELLDKDIQNLSRIKPEYDRVKAELEKYEKRKVAIAALKKERVIEWSPILDRVCTVVHNNKWVWLLSLDAGEGQPKVQGLSAQLDMYVILKVNGTASKEDLDRNRLPEVQTAFKTNLWGEFGVGAGSSSTSRPTPFDYSDDNFAIDRKEDPSYREYSYLTYTAVLGRKLAQAAPTKPGQKPK